MMGLFDFDPKTLREVPNDRARLEEIIAELEKKISATKDFSEKVNYLGELGTYLRILGKLELAEEKLLLALAFIRSKALGPKKEIQQKIRLAHVYQWKKDFEKSNSFFKEILETCRSSAAAESYLDFALQHAGKNFYDQGMFLEAKELFEEALKIRKSKKAPKDQIESTELALQEVSRRLNEMP